MLNLEERKGIRPGTHFGLPHQQLDQLPSQELHERTAEAFLTMAETTTGPSLISVPGARALFLDCKGECNEDTGFMVGREFAHIHPPHDGSFHMVLSAEDSAHVVARGWGELHPWTLEKRLPASIVLIYAPRDDEEIQVVLQIASAAQQNAKTPNRARIGA